MYFKVTIIILIFVGILHAKPIEIEDKVFKFIDDSTMREKNNQERNSVSTSCNDDGCNTIISSYDSKSQLHIFNNGNEYIVYGTDNHGNKLDISFGQIKFSINHHWYVFVSTIIIGYYLYLK